MGLCHYSKYFIILLIALLISLEFLIIGVK